MILYTKSIHVTDDCSVDTTIVVSKRKLQRNIRSMVLALTIIQPMIYIIIIQAIISSFLNVNGFSFTVNLTRQPNSHLSLLPKSVVTMYNNNHINDINIIQPSQPSSSSTWDIWCKDQLQIQYHHVLGIKCPFFRRRFSDVLDGLDMILQFIVIRHKSIPMIDTTTLLPSRLSTRHGTHGNIGKLYHLHPEEIVSIIIDDWKVSNHKGYYVTGKLTTCIYQDDVVFDGPDPDMPVRGLSKYMNAASQLFDIKNTFSELVSIYIDTNDNDKETTTTTTATRIVAKWKMHGRLRLPWKPIVPEWTGTTIYYINPYTGLIHQHIETWDISVHQAFIQTLCPLIAQWMYGEKVKKRCL
jgi:Uncharacterized conserved protein (DUF2358)